MRRVESVIDTWYDSGAMPFAQFHYPFENEAEFEERFPADFICEAHDQTRGWFYTLLAESTLLFDELELPQLRLPRPHPRPRGPEDVEEPRQRGRPLGRDLRPRRRRLPLVLPDRAAALVGVPVLGRHGRRVGAPVPAHPLEHLLLLGPLRERRGPRPDDFARPGRSADRPPTTSTAGRSRDCRRRPRPCASGWTSSTAPPPAGRSPSTSRSSPTGTCGSRAGASGTATAPPSRPCATACWRPRRCSPPSPPSSPTRSTSTSPAACSGRPASADDSVHLRDFPELDPALADPELETAMEAVRLTVELGRAARAQAKAKVRQPLRRAVIVANDAERAGDRSPRRSRHRRAQRQGARFRHRRGGAGQLHGQAQLPRPRAPLRQADAAGRRRGRGARRRPRRPR